MEVPPLSRPGPIPEVYNFDLLADEQKEWSWRVMLVNRLENAAVPKGKRDSTDHI